MSNFFYNNRKFLIAILSVLCALSLLVLPFLGINVARGEEGSSPTQRTFETENFAPTFDSMVFDVTTPVDALSFGDNVAVIVKDSLNSSSLWISKNGQAFAEVDLSYDNPGQIKALDDNVLIVRDHTSLYKIDCSQSTLVPLPFQYDGNTVTCDKFDINQNFLVTRTSKKIILYTLGEVMSETSLGESAKADTPICVNSSGTVFYIGDDNYIHSYYVDSSLIGHDSVLTSEIDGNSVSHMIASENQLYLIVSGDIKVLSNELTTLSKPVDNNNDLGNLTSPVSISFKGENLFIADNGINAIQEFKVVDDSLVWTGYAIAEGKRAYNRFAGTVVNVDRTNDNLAVLTNDRITLVDLENFDYLNKEAYLSLYAVDFGGTMPQDIAVGKSTLLATDSRLVNSSPVNKIYIYDFNEANSPNPKVIDVDINAIYDCCYQSGYYYVLYNVGSSLCVYKIDEATQEIVGSPTTVEENKTFSNPAFTVDVFGNYHIYDGYKKIDSDLTGSVFAVKEDGFYELVDGVFQRTIQETSLNSFTLDIDKKEVYYTKNGSEFVFKATDIGNKAINDTAIPSGDIYKTTDSNAIENGLTAYQVTQNQNVYSITEKDGYFKFQELTAHEDYYLFVCDLENIYEGINHSVLVGQNGLVMVANSNLTVKQIDQVSINQTKFVSTEVCAYYYPVIEEESWFALTDAEGKIRLSKGQEITAKYSVEILGKTFYFATFTLDGREVSGYIPVDFTVDELSVDLKFVTFTVETTTGVEVFGDLALKNKIATLEKGTTVRLYSTENGISKIAYFDGQNWVEGYIAEDSIEQKPNTTIRNLLIILALTACVCGTITYFIIRKKDE